MRRKYWLGLGWLGLGLVGIASVACSGGVGDDGAMASVPSGDPSNTVPGGPVPTDMNGAPVGPVPTDSMGNPVPANTDEPGPGPDPSSTTPEPDDDPPIEPTECAATVAAGLVLLSDIQYVNSIRALMGDGALTADNLPVEETKPFSRKILSLTTSLVITRMDWAEDAANSIAGRVSEVSGCQDGDAVCAESYLTDVAQRAFRRAVTAEEAQALMTVFEAGLESDYDTAVRLAIEAILSSPSFFYRTEFGEPAADGTVVLTPTELASELAYLLTDGPPDEQLLAAGLDGSLADDAVVVQHVERILAAPETQENLTSTLMAAWSFGNLAGVDKDDNLFPTFDALRPRMYQETKLFLQDVLWTRGADVSEVLSSPVTFVDSMLAELYGVPFTGSDPNEFVQVTLPATERAGMLTQASVMSARSRTDKTSVVSRGIFVRGDLMCLPKIALPDGNQELNELIEEQAADPNLSEKEKADDRAMTRPCSDCHSQFDAFGVPLEYYDPIGRYTPQADDTTVDLAAVVGLMAGSPTASDGIELSLALAAAPQFKSCVTRHMLSYAIGADELLANSCDVQQAAGALPELTTMADIITAVAASPTLRIRMGGDQ